jgi:ligand-binding sensor domain-containing protein/signal transduction histidine kinase
MYSIPIIKMIKRFTVAYLPVLIISFLLCVIHMPEAAGSRVQFEHVSVELGLSSSSVYAIEQTPDGYIWIGTQNGLERYDGYSFTLYSFKPGERNVLSNNWVKALATDKYGNLWVGTNNGLNRYNRFNDTFTTFFSDKSNPDTPPSDNIWNIYKDAEGVLWIGSNKGLSRFDEKTECFTSFSFTDPNSPNSKKWAVNTIADTDDGNLWVGTWGGGLFKFDKAKGTHEQVFFSAQGEKNNRNYLKAIYRDDAGRVWIGTNGGGLIALQVKTGKTTTYLHDSNDSTSLSDNTILSLYGDKLNGIAVGTYSGGLNFLSFDEPSKGFVCYKPDNRDSKSLQGNWITSIYRDQSGLLWLGHNNGVSKFRIEGPRFAHFKHTPGLHNSLPKCNVNCIFEDQDGLIWIGTWGGGLTCFNPLSGRYTHYLHNPKNKASIADNRVWSIVQDKEGALWIATSKGLDRLPKNGSQFEHIGEQEAWKFAEQLKSKNLSHLVIDKNDNIWISTWGSGQFIMNPKKRELSHFGYVPGDTNSLRTDQIKNLFIDSTGDVWICTSDRGLDHLRFDKNGNAKFTNYTYDPSNAESISSNSPIIVFEDSKARLWIGTDGGGLNLYNREKQTFSRVQMAGVKGLNSVPGILEDKRGNLWLSSNAGIVKFQPEKGTVKAYDMADGLQSTVFLHGQYKTKSGAMLFGGHNGFNMFEPEKLMDSDFVPSVQIHELKVFNETIVPGVLHKNADAGRLAILDKPLYLCDTIYLSYKDYVLSFGFASLDYNAPHKNKYAYMLENFESKWNFTDASQRFATYTNLNPGTYTLHVKASNSDGIWIEKAARLTLIIAPPFWETLWFRIVLLVSMGIVVFSVHRFWLRLRFDRLLATERIKTQETDKIRKRVAMDFHDEMGNQLASITALINLINIRKAKNEHHIDDLLAKLSQHAQSLFNGTKDFIWSIDPKSDHAEAILINIRDFAEDLFDSTSVNFYFQTTPEAKAISLLPGYSRHITLMCKELFTNIVKHAHAKNVYVSAQLTDIGLLIAIEDDGCGFDLEAHRAKGYGLNNLQVRANKIKASLCYTTAPGKGTRVEITITVPAIREKKNVDKLEFA